MKRKWIDALWVMGVLLMAGFCLSACNRELDVQTVFLFEVSTMPVPKQIKQGETVEVRCSLVSEGDFSGTRYTMRFFQTEGKGVLRIGRGVALKPNDCYPVGKGDFRLYYTSRSKDQFPGLTTPDPSYHGIVYTEKFGKTAYLVKATVQLMRDFGSTTSPMNAFLLNIGLETLHLRIPRHCSNAQAVAEYLAGHPKVAWVNYCGLPENKYHTLARKYLPEGSCGMLTLGLKGGRDHAIRFMDALRLVSIVTHVADVRSCVLHPASHTHRQLSDEQLVAAGVAPDLIRFSVGIEDIDDILADVQQALEKA